MKRILVPTNGSDDRLLQSFVDVKATNWAKFKSTCGNIEATFRTKRNYTIADLAKRLDGDAIVIEDIEPRGREVSVFVASRDGVLKHEMALPGVLVTPQDWDEEPSTEEEERQFYLESSVEQT